jgi:hypothetical protein
VSVTGAVLLAVSGALAWAVPATADDPPPPPPLPRAPGYPPPGLLAVPGSTGPPYGYQNGLLPILPGTVNSPVDAAGVAVGTNADQTDTGMPGSRLGSMPNRAGPFGPAPGVRVSGAGSAGVTVSSNADNPPDPPIQVPAPPTTLGQTP